MILNFVYNSPASTDTIFSGFPLCGMRTINVEESLYCISTRVSKTMVEYE